MMNGRTIKAAMICGLVWLASGCQEDDGPGVQINNGGGGSLPGVVKPGPDMPADLVVADQDPDAAPSVGGDLVPTEPGLLIDYLQRGGYKGFPSSNTVVRRSTGPHPAQRTFFNQRLTDSFETPGAQHPVGAAAVKELYESDNKTLRGWAVQVKVDADSDAGQGWYWYETLNTDGLDPVADGRGVPLCSNCHLAGEDLILSPYPLE
jgi:hypothetical protein